MKYIIDVPKDRVSKGGKLELLCEIENSLPQYIHTAIDAEPYTEPDEDEIRQKIEQEVWELADYMGRMSLTERDLCFGFPLPQEVTMNLSYQEAKAKFKAWLKEKNEIKVGDEIVGIYSDGEKSPPLVVLKVEGNYYYGMYSKTGEFVQGGLNYEKTGRHFPEVAELLEKMRGEEQ